MLDFYLAYSSPNSQKVRIFLEEVGLEHKLILVDIGKGEQHKPEYLAISPNNKVPALVDHAPADDGAPLVLFESGAILLYLAEKTGRFLARDLRGREQALTWLFWQMGGLGPMAGQAGHFLVYAPEPVPYAIERYVKELARLYGVLDRHLAGREYIAGDYGIADMACYPWIVSHEGHSQVLADFPDLARWFESIHARPAVQRAFVHARDVYAGGRRHLTEEQRRSLFGQGKP